MLEGGACPVLKEVQPPRPEGKAVTEGSAGAGGEVREACPGAKACFCGKQDGAAAACSDVSAGWEVKAGKVCGKGDSCGKAWRASGWGARGGWRHRLR